MGIYRFHAPRVGIPGYASRSGLYPGMPLRVGYSVLATPVGYSVLATPVGYPSCPPVGYPSCHTRGLFSQVTPVGYSPVVHPWVGSFRYTRGLFFPLHPWVIPGCATLCVIPGCATLWVIPSREVYSRGGYSPEEVYFRNWETVQERQRNPAQREGVHRERQN